MTDNGTPAGTSSASSAVDEREAIYERLAKAWRMARIDREVVWQEVVFVPISGDFAQIGAAIFLAVLCYPEDRAKRDRFCDAIGASILKSSTKPKSHERRQLRESPRAAALRVLPR